jgi:hypothetical protein
VEVMGSGELEKWVRQLGETLSELATQDLGYPHGRNEILPPLSPRPDLPSELEPLYTVSNGLHLPDVYVGYFIDPADRVASAAMRGEPMRIEGSNLAHIHVFGSDGGGGRFALCLDDGSVYYLPASGAVKNGAFYAENAAIPKRVAETLIDFLWRLKSDVDAFVRAKEGHEYMAQ